MRDLNEIRVDIDAIDSQIVALYEQRMELTKQVAEYKIANNKPVLDAAREAVKLERIAELVKDPEYKDGAVALFEAIMAISRAQQQVLLDENR